MFQAKKRQQQQQGPVEHRTTKHRKILRSTEHMSR